MTPAKRSLRPSFDPVFGDRKLDVEMRGNFVKRNLANARAWYIDQHYGKATRERIAESLYPAASDALMNPCLPFTWLEMGVLMDMDRAMIEHTMDGDVEKFSGFSDAVARHDLTSTYKLFIKMGTPAFILKKAGIVCSLYFKDTTVRLVAQSPNSASLVLVGRRWPSYFCRYGTMSMLSNCIQLSGGKDVVADHAACCHRGEGECRWDLRWS